ncbi:hypothetical protein BAUCODRAFT_461103 [Baudoinia panamericana UAMH 10762]|uniref:Uncharacterized protein n=1 Tax=Baudoinia panamericana (strain UAMH 10762) TaxID=717646 RepID=M2LT38_BAUPA|nr:uncharacterized protein BAUCODRAFT_461103 [Baudoinia panamericana UAMH 10762]EMC97682.1 hypothetical protein BAUCODRAFT_461103 [Baudoinia panamericana UAMH 10762]
MSENSSTERSAADGGQDCVQLTDSVLETFEEHGGSRFTREAAVALGSLKQSMLGGFNNGENGVVLQIPHLGRIQLKHPFYRSKTPPPREESARPLPHASPGPFLTRRNSRLLNSFCTQEVEFQKRLTPILPLVPGYRTSLQAKSLPT